MFALNGVAASYPLLDDREHTDSPAIRPPRHVSQLIRLDVVRLILTTEAVSTAAQYLRSDGEDAAF